jgi:drug/metabolite transporter (DMT)-like permease
MIPREDLPAASLQRRWALPVLLLVTVIWGWSFPWMKQAMLEAGVAWGRPGGLAAVALFMLLRFGMAALAVALALPASRRGWDKGTVRGGVVLGVLLLAGFVLQLLGLETVSPSVSAFLTSLYVVFSALLVSALRRARPRRSLIAGVVLATLGAGFISGPPRIAFGRGEWLTVGCAIVFAVHILATDAVTRRRPALATTLVAFLTVTAGSAVLLAGSIWLNGRPLAGEILGLLPRPGFLQPFLLSLVFATLLALPLMMIFQRELDPVRAAVLYAVEPVWASLFAVALGMGRLDRWLFIGGGALLGGNLIAELGPRLRPGRPGGQARAEGEDPRHDLAPDAAGAHHSLHPASACSPGSVNTAPRHPEGGSRQGSSAPDLRPPPPRPRG